MIRPTTGERIKQLRIEKEISQQVLADRLFVTQPAVAAYETNTRTPEITVLISLSDFFQVSIDYLLCIVNERTRITDICLCQLTAEEEQAVEALRKLPEGVKKSFINILEFINGYKIDVDD